MDRQKKREVIDSAFEDISGASLVILSEQNGMTVDQATKLRVEMRKNNSKFKVLKNTLAKLAVKNTQFEDLAKDFKGSVAISYSKDPIAAAKVLVNFCDKVSSVVIKIGSLNGKLLNESDIKSLATLPSLDELRAKVIGLITAPMSKNIRIIKEPGSMIARALNAYANKS